MGGTRLIKVVCPNIETIGSHAFVGCWALHDIVGQPSVINSHAFEGAAALLEADLRRVTHLYDHAFDSCRSLVRVLMPEGELEQCGEAIFANCVGLQRLNLGGLASVPQSFCENCSALSIIHFVSSTVSIQISAFAHCTALASATAPGVERIEDLAFKCCECLSKVDFPSLAFLGYGAFLRSGVERVRLDKVAFLEERAFDHCRCLREFSGAKAYRANARCFESCVQLQSVSLPSVTLVEKNAFTHCGSLREVNATQLKDVGEFTFVGCLSLSITLRRLRSNAFILSAIRITKVTDMIDFLGIEHSACCLNVEHVDFLAGEIPPGIFSNCPNLRQVSFEGRKIGNHLRTVPTFTMSPSRR